MQAEKLGVKPTGGAAWTHNFLNQKYWHPLSFQNQAGPARYCSRSLRHGMPLYMTKCAKPLRL